MRIALVSEREGRTRLEETYDRCVRRDELLGRALLRAETTYINRHLQLEPVFQPSPMGDVDTYNAQVRQLRADFHARPETKDFKHRLSNRSNSAWEELGSKVRQTVRQQNKTRLSRDSFIEARSQSRDLRPRFHRAIRR